jgi:hypothetical protein
MQRIVGLETHTVGDFWAWAYSDLISNTVRPMFAEYLVGECLGVADQPRTEWNCVDFRYRGRGIEVKSAGYVQAWIQKSPSKISFDIAERNAPWDARTNTSLPKGRSADVYVLCVHTDQTRDDCIVHDVAKWDFYVMTVKKLGEAFSSQKTIALGRLQSHCSAVKYPSLRSAIDTEIDSLQPYDSLPLTLPPSPLA